MRALLAAIADNDKFVQIHHLILEHNSNGITARKRMCVCFVTYVAKGQLGVFRTYCKLEMALVVGLYLATATVCGNRNTSQSFSIRISNATTELTLLWNVCRKFSTQAREIRLSDNIYLPIRNKIAVVCRT